MSQLVSNQDNPISIFDSQGLNEKVVEPAVAYLFPQYETVMDTLIEQLDNGTITKTDNRKFQIYRQPNTYGGPVISSRTIVGSSLKLTFADSSFAGIPTGNMVYANNGCEGLVATKGPGYMTINFLQKPDQSTAFVTADFAAGEQAIDGGDVGDTVNRVSKETIFYTPDNYPGVIQMINNSAYIGMDEMFTKTYIPAANGKQFYYYQKQADALKVMKQQYIKRMYSNTPANFNANKPISASPINQILTMGGLTQSLGATSTFTADQFQGWIRDFVALGGIATNSNELILIPGPEFMANFQSTFSSAQIQYVGINNTVGGKDVKGINFMEYGYMGLSMKFKMEPILGNPKMFPVASNGRTARSNSCIVMSAAPVQTKNMGMLPFATSRYFGPVADIAHTVIRGVVDENGNVSPMGTATNPQAGVSHEFFMNKCNVLSNPAACMYIGS